jgi:cytidylate kinase
MTHVVTISATYGAGGARVGPAVARRLGVPFVDRAIPGAVAKGIGCSLEEALHHDDRAPTGLDRLLAGAARLPGASLSGVEAAYVGATGPEGRLLYDREFVEHTEHVIRAVGGRGGVVLGRAAAVVLADVPHALHVRLDGPRERRLEQAAALRRSGGEDAPPDRGERDDTTGAAWHPPTLRDLDDNDRARAAYVRRFYRTDPAAPGLYHLLVDSTAVALTTIVDVVERLARERAEAAGRR